MKYVKKLCVAKTYAENITHITKNKNTIENEKW